MKSEAFKILLFLPILDNHAQDNELNIGQHIGKATVPFAPSYITNQIVKLPRSSHMLTRCYYHITRYYPRKMATCKMISCSFDGRWWHIKVLLFTSSVELPESQRVVRTSPTLILLGNQRASVLIFDIFNRRELAPTLEITPAFEKHAHFINHAHFSQLYSHRCQIS